LGEIKLLILIRDPVFRAWFSARRRECFDLDSVRHFMKQSKLPYPGLDSSLDFGNYSKVLHRWLSLFDRDSLHVVWFPDIIERPAEVIGEVLDHVGAAPERFPWGSLKLSKVNSNPRCDMPPDVQPKEATEYLLPFSASLTRADWLTLERRYYRLKWGELRLRIKGKIARMLSSGSARGMG